MSDDGTVSVRITGAVDSSLTSSVSTATDALAGLGDQAKTSATAFATVNTSMTASGEAAEITAGRYAAFGATLSGIMDGLDGLSAGLAAMPVEFDAAAAGAEALAVGVGVLESAFAPLRAMFAAVEIFRFGEGLVESAAGVYHEAEVLQMGTTALQDFQESARLAEVDVATTDMAIRRFTVSLGLAQSGTGVQAKAFSDLGVSANQSSDEALPKIARALLDVHDAGKKAADEVALFSRSGEELNPALSAWAEGTDALTKKLTDMGLILDPKTVDGAHNADVALTQAFDHMKVSWTPAATAFANILAGIPGALEDVAKAGDDLSGDAAVKKWTADQLNPPKPPPPPAPPPVPKPIANPDAVAAEADLANLGQIDAKIAERKTLTDNLTTANKTLQEQLSTGNAKGIADAQQAVGDIQKALKELNKPEATDNKAAEQAKQQADSIIATNKALQDAIVEGAKQANTAQLALGQESLGQYTEQALSQANAKYDAAVQGFEREAATGKLTHAEMLAELALADQQWSNEVNAIWEQTAEKQRATDEKGFADYQKQLDEQVKATEDANQRMYESGQMTAQQKVAADLAALDASKGADDQHFAQLTANWNTESEAYKTELEKRNDFDKQYNEQRRTLETQSANDAVAQWRTTDQQILSAESSLVSDIFSKRQGLGADLREIGLKTLEDEITNDLKMLTEHEMVNLGMMKSDQATSQGGLIFKLGQYALDKAGILSTETAKVVSVAAGQASQNAAVASGEAAGKAVSLTAAETEIATNAAVAASGAMAAIAMIPYVGPIMAPAAAAATYAETMAYAGLASAEGGQLQVPFDGQLTELHRNEMVLPASVAGPMRDHFAGAPNGDVAGGGGDMHTHFNLSTLGARDLESMVRNNMSMFMKIAKNHARNSVGRR